MRIALVAFVLACACAIQPAQAVRPGQPASTAEWVCLYRAIAAQHPDPKLRNPDDLAEKLCWWPPMFPDNYAGARKVIDDRGVVFAGRIGGERHRTACAERGPVLDRALLGLNDQTQIPDQLVAWVTRGDA